MRGLAISDPVTIFVADDSYGRPGPQIGELWEFDVPPP